MGHDRDLVIHISRRLRSADLSTACKPSCVRSCKHIPDQSWGVERQIRLQRLHTQERVKGAVEDDGVMHPISSGSKQLRKTSDISSSGRYPDAVQITPFIEEMSVRGSQTLSGSKRMKRRDGAGPDSGCRHVGLHCISSMLCWLPEP